MVSFHHFILLKQVQRAASKQPFDYHRPPSCYTIVDRRRTVRFGRAATRTMWAPSPLTWPCFGYAGGVSTGESDHVPRILILISWRFSVWPPCLICLLFFGPNLIYLTTNDGIYLSHPVHSRLPISSSSMRFAMAPLVRMTRSHRGLSYICISCVLM